MGIMINGITTQRTTIEMIPQIQFTINISTMPAIRTINPPICSNNPNGVSKIIGRLRGDLAAIIQYENKTAPKKRSIIPEANIISNTNTVNI